MSIRATISSTGENKPALVLVHGLGSAATIWKMLTPELVNFFDVYAIDLPGHGEADLIGDNGYDPASLASSIIDYMEREHGVTEMHVAGNSLGGWIALEMGAVSSSKVRSVTALAPAGLWNQVPTKKYPPSLDARILAKIAQFFIPIAYYLPPLKALGYRKITHLWRELSYESCKDSVVAMASAKGFFPLWQGIRGRKFESNVDEKVSTSIIFGDYDLLLPEEIAQEKSVAPHHARWVFVENCAHVIMWNYPRLTVNFIRQAAGVAS